MRTGYEKACNGCVAEGIEWIRELKGLGQSFASKQLRFLMPDRAVILDSVIRKRLGYNETLPGYSKFLADCLTLRDQAHKSEEVRGLRVCDIEAALYTKIQVEDPEKKNWKLS